MPWQVIQYFDENPNTTPHHAIKHFAEELQIDQQTEALVSEVDEVLILREQMRPLYAQKADIEHNLVLLNSGFDMEIMMEFPPGKKGNPERRKAKKIELQTKSDSYQSKINELQSIKEQIELLETKLYEVESRAKNARKIVDTFNHYAEFILSYSKDDKRIESRNDGLF